MTEPAALQAQRRAVAALRAALGAELVETHISFVLIDRVHAWKIKKALDLGFADFRSLAQRRFYCNEELRLNRRTAPQLYLQVLPLTGTPEAPHIGGDGAPFDWVLQMRAFDQAGLWDRLGALRLRHAGAAARTDERQLAAARPGLPRRRRSRHAAPAARLGGAGLRRAARHLPAAPHRRLRA